MQAGECTPLAVVQSLPQSPQAFALAGRTGTDDPAACMRIIKGTPTPTSFGRNITADWAPILSPETLSQQYSVCSDTGWQQSTGGLHTHAQGPYHTWLYIHNPCPLFAAVVALEITRSGAFPAC